MKPLLLLTWLAGSVVFAQGSADIPARIWAASWIDVPNTSPQDYGVYHFRRVFDLPAKPERFTIYVSGDNRYQLYVNGKRVSYGPARGDLAHWRFETVDIAPELVAGKNSLAAVVWNDGPYRAIAQVTNQTGFILQAADGADPVVNTNREWKCIRDAAYSPQPLPADEATGYYALAANEKVDARQYPWGWEQTNFDDSAWLNARQLTRGAPRYAVDAPNRWMLVPSEIPVEEQKPERLSKVRESAGATVSDAFLQGQRSFRVAPHSTATLLVDQGYLTTAYPELQLSGGAGSTLLLRYAESLFISKGGHGVPPNKGNRNEVEGKHFYGPADTYISDGGLHRMYRPLYWRTYRYLQLTVATAGTPAVIEDLRGTFTGYPFDKRAEFEANPSPANEEIQPILSTGWRTARLCAHETYMDCPFYEQLQYAGDARIQMMISLYMTGDSRLMKNGIALLNSSRTAEGATYSRAPSYLQQYIPPFSLWWIGMVHDYWMYVNDPGFVKQMLPGVRAVLSFYNGYQGENGSLNPMPWWNFVDWVKQWPRGVPPGNANGASSAALDLQLLLAYQWASDLERALGNPALATQDAEAANRLKSTVLATDWDPARGLFADQPEHRTYSQQVNTLAILAHLVPPDQGRSVMEKVLTDSSLAQSSIYFRAYTNATLREVGLGDRYLDVLGPWRQMLNDGLTTWAEWNGPDARSDCHAWGASPNFEFLRTVAGIESMAPGFAKVKIAPNLGQLTTVSARMPHPKGEIRVELQRRSAKLTANVELPSGVSGEFDWAGQQRPLQPGKNHINF